MDDKIKLYLKIYGCILVIAFLTGPQAGLVKYDLVYNMTCDDGTIEWFNQTKEIVCGERNPFYVEEDYKYEYNYFESFNRT